MREKIRKTLKDKMKLGRALFIGLSFIWLWYFFFLGTSSLRPLTGVVIPLTVLLAFAFILFHKKQLVFTPCDLVALIAFVISAISAIYSKDSLVSIKYAISMLSYYFAAKFMIAQNYIKFETIVKLIFGFAIFFLITVYFEKFFTNAFNATLLKLLPPENKDLVLNNQSNRLFGGLAVFTDQSEIFLLIGFVSSLYLYSIKPSLFLKILYIVTATLFAIGLAFTGRRAGLILIFVIVFCYLAIITSSIWPVIVFIIPVFIVLGLLSMKNPRSVPIIGDILARTKYYISNNMFFKDRIELVNAAFGLINKKPLIGYGADTSSVVIGNGFSSFHNSYVESLFDFGYIVGIIYLICIVSPIIVLAVFYFIKYFKQQMSYKETSRFFLSFSFCLSMLFLSIVESLFNNPSIMFIFFVFAQILFSEFSKKTQKMPVITFNITRNKRPFIYFKIETFTSAYEITNQNKKTLLFYMPCTDDDHSVSKNLFLEAINVYSKLNYEISVITNFTGGNLINNTAIKVFLINDDKSFRKDLNPVLINLIDNEYRQNIIFNLSQNMFNSVGKLFHYGIGSSYIFDTSFDAFYKKQNILKKLSFKQSLNLIFNCICFDEESFLSLKDKRTKKLKENVVLLKEDNKTNAFDKLIYDQLI